MNGWFVGLVFAENQSFRRSTCQTVFVSIASANMCASVPWCQTRKPTGRTDCYSVRCEQQTLALSRSSSDDDPNEPIAATIVGALLSSSPECCGAPPQLAQQMWVASATLHRHGVRGRTIITHRKSNPKFNPFINARHCARGSRDFLRE